MRHGGHYEPMMHDGGTIMFPQPGGGSNWGGGAFDPQRNLLITPVSQIPYYVKLIPNEEVDPVAASKPGAGAPMQGPGYIGGTPYACRAGTTDVAVLHALHGAALEHAGGGGHGRGRDQVEGALRRARRADARADSAELSARRRPADPS